MRSPDSADAGLVSALTTPEPVVDALRASAERAAQAALRELPEALVLDFDGELRVVRAAGVALERLDDPDCASPGRSLADVDKAGLLRGLFDRARNTAGDGTADEMTRGNAILRVEPMRALTSDGLTPEAASLTRTSPGPGCGVSTSPTWSTSRAGPFLS